MLRTPPEILITTPESLNILVSAKGSRRMLTGVVVVILDEIHAVAGGKRGVHLMMAVDRLVPLSGEFQRIALSATVKPMARIAEFIGGYEMHGDAGETVYEKRPVTLIQSDMQKEMTLRVDFPANAGERMVDDSRWPALVESFKEIIHKNRSTLLFTNSRRMAEKVARLINEGEPEELAYSHHGSLSKELRLVVEQKLKRGELKAIVATNSLELGIDIGDLGPGGTDPDPARHIIGHPAHRPLRARRGRGEPGDIVSHSRQGFYQCRGSGASRYETGYGNH